MITYDSFVFVDVLEYVLRDEEGNIGKQTLLRVQIAKIPNYVKIKYMQFI